MSDRLKRWLDGTFPREDRWPLVILLVSYAVVLGGLAWRRFSVFGWDTADFGNFDSMFWWTLRGKPFYFATREMSNFGLHAAFLWVQLVPVYWLFPGVKTLIVAQTVFLTAAAIPVYWIARQMFADGKVAICLAGAFLVFPPIISQHVNQVEEPSFVAVYLLLAFYFFQSQRFGWFVLLAFVSCLGRENVPLAIAMFGVYAAFLRRPVRWVVTPLLLGATYFVIVTFWVMPWFRQGESWDITNRMFTYLGNTPGTIVKTAITQPGIVLDHLTRRDNVQYVILLVQPLAWVLPWLSGASLMALPDLAINLVSDNTAMKVIPWHYNVVTGVFLFLGAVGSLARLGRWLNKRLPGSNHTLACAVSLLVLGLVHWFVWLAPYQYVKLPHHDALVGALKQVPAEASVLVPARLQGHVGARARWHNISLLQDDPSRAMDYEYVILDANERQFGPPITQEFFDALYKSPAYRLVFAERNVFVFRRSTIGAP